MNIFLKDNIIIGSEKIVHIENLKGIEDDYDGFYIVTKNINSNEEKCYYIYISNYQECCETFGSICTNDDYRDFFGSELKEIKFFNRDYIDGDLSVDSNYCVFIDFETDRGVLQFVVYNDHNGYYGHDVKFKIEYEKNTIEYGIIL